MIESYLAKVVAKSKDALYFVGLNHRTQNVSKCARWEPVRTPLLVSESGCCEYRADVVRGVAGFQRYPRVAEVEPANEAADAKGSG
jgi:hypothetical protein